MGAVSVLIIDVAIRCGFPCGASAATGAATADMLYSAAAVVGGAGIASAVDAIGAPLEYLSAIVLIAIGVVGLRRARQPREPVDVSLPGRRELFGTYARFLGITAINPATVLYFAAVVIGLGIASGLTAGEGALFVAGAFAASLSWQLILAAGGAYAGHRLPARVQTGAIVVGNLLVLGFAVVILVR